MLPGRSLEKVGREPTLGDKDSAPLGQVIEHLAPMIYDPYFDLW